MAEGDDPFSSLEALLGSGGDEAESESESDVEQEAADDADDPFADMAALLQTDEDDELAEDTAPSVQRSDSEIAASSDDAYGVPQATGESLAWQGTVSTQLLEEPTPGRSWSHGLSESEHKPRAELEPEPEPQPEIEPDSDPEPEPKPSLPTSTYARHGQPSVFNSGVRDEALTKSLASAPTTLPASAVVSQMSQEPEEPSLTTTMCDDDDASVESVTAENKELRQLVASLSSSLKAERTQCSILSAEKREALQHVRVLERRLARMLDASTASNVHEALWSHGALPGQSSSFRGPSTGRLNSVPSTPSPRPRLVQHRPDGDQVEDGAGAANDSSTFSAVKQARWRQWRTEHELLPVKRLRLLVEKTGCSKAQVEKARNTDDPRESLLQLLMEVWWQQLEAEQATLAKRRLLEEDAERQRAARVAQLLQMDVKCLVDMAAQMPSVTPAELQRARDHSSPRGALISLLQQAVVVPKPKPAPRIFSLAAAGDAAAVRRKLDRGADPNEANADQTTALYRAAANGHTDVVGLLLQGRADPNRPGNPRTKKTALMAASVHGHAQTVQLLLRYGAKRSAKDEASRTALQLAHAHRHVQCEELLRNHGGGKNEGGIGTEMGRSELESVVDM